MIKSRDPVLIAQQFGVTAPTDTERAMIHAIMLLDRAWEGERIAVLRMKRRLRALADELLRLPPLQQIPTMAQEPIDTFEGVPVFVQTGTLVTVSGPCFIVPSAEIWAQCPDAERRRMVADAKARYRAQVAP